MKIPIRPSLTNELVHKVATIECEHMADVSPNDIVNLYDSIDGWSNIAVRLEKSKGIKLPRKDFERIDMLRFKCEYGVLLMQWEWARVYDITLKHPVGTETTLG